MTTSRKAATCAAKSVTLAAILMLSGCLPYSCGRTESRELTPADSVSRLAAESAPTDTLRLVRATTGTDESTLEFPRTVRFGDDGVIYVTDVERRSLFLFADRFTTKEIPLEIEAPYLAGLSGDTVAVFSPSNLAIYRLVGGEITDSTMIDDPQRNESSLVYGTVGDRIHYKRVGPEQEGIVVSFAAGGDRIDTTRLPAPHWRHAGLLKTWGDTVVSLSGFRPVVDLITSSGAGTAGGGSTSSDTLSLVGFDSPMLARSRAFMLGEVHEAPLLSASAAAAGDHLFVMNMRAGWLQVDVFGRDGRIQHRLVESTADYRSAFFPQDIDVRRVQDGYELAVILSQPDPELRVFRWTPGASGHLEVGGDSLQQPSSGGPASSVQTSAQ